MFWLAEDHRVTAQAAASRNPEGGLDFYVRLRGLQSGAHAQLVSRYCSGAVKAGRGVSTALTNATRALRSAKNHPADTQKLPNDANQPRNCWRSTILQQPARKVRNQGKTLLVIRSLVFLDAVCSMGRFLFSYRCIREDI